MCRKTNVPNDVFQSDYRRRIYYLTSNNLNNTCVHVCNVSEKISFLNITRLFKSRYGLGRKSNRRQYETPDLADVCRTHKRYGFFSLSVDMVFLTAAKTTQTSDGVRVRKIIRSNSPTIRWIQKYIPFAFH